MCRQEMKELAALAYRDTTAESRDFWKNEMAQAIREIEQMYADKLDTMKVEMESSYNLKVGPHFRHLVRQIAPSLIVACRLRTFF